jgi:ABC-type polysaccharide/polyol phosphate transport system ATPase subunit
MLVEGPGIGSNIGAAAGSGTASFHTPLSATVTNSAEARARRLAAAPTAVSVRSVSKSFRLPHQRFSTLKERVLHPFAARTEDVLEALRDVDCEVRSGEFFGVVGRNGSGKSTLLKCLAGIYALDSGEISVEGRLSPFIELGVGFNPDLTARDNVLINAIMLGLSKREAQARFDEIIEFAELQDFIDLKLKNYSSGMSVRLGFSVAIQVDAEVLLVDEVLAVGDASFQQKCFEQFDRMKGEGRTILYVTHDMGSVERFCDRGIVLERGEVVDEGPPEVITRTYSELNFGHARQTTPEGQAAARIVSAWCEGSDGERIITSRQGEECAVCVEVEFGEPVDEPVFSVVIRNDVRHTILVLATDASGRRTGRFGPGDRRTVRFRFENRLAPSRYTLTPSVGAIGRSSDYYARAEDLATLMVQASALTGGVVDLPYELEIDES